MSQEAETYAAVDSVARVERAGQAVVSGWEAAGWSVPAEDLF
jgi:hypothetical protein